MSVKVKAYRGAWWIFVDYKNRRKAKRVGTGKEGKRAALAAAEQIEARLALGESTWLETPCQTGQTFQEYVERWLEGDVALRLKAGTIDKYGEVIRAHWLPALGSRPLASITGEQIKTVLRKKLTEGRKPSSVRLMLSVLVACLNTAVEEQLIRTNPAVRAGKLVSAAGKTPPAKIFTRPELASLLQTAEREMADSYPVVLLLARTGLRLGEALSLQVVDVDFERRELWVRRTWGSRRKSLGEQRFNLPKGNKVRRVDMSRQLCEVLRAYLERKADDSVWLFPGDHGDPLDPNRFRKYAWRPLLQRAGLPYRKPHTLRHTYASLLLQNGESPAYVKEQLGHASIKITVDVYGHLIPGANRQAVDRLDEDPGRNPDATNRRPVLRLVRGGEM